MQISNIVALGDIHRSFNTLITILRNAELIDITNKWYARNTIVVFLGDLVDRGPRSIDVVQIIKSLQQQAYSFNSLVIVLNGNHDTLYANHNSCEKHFDWYYSEKVGLNHDEMHKYFGFKQDLLPANAICKLLS